MIGVELSDECLSACVQLHVSSIVWYGQIIELYSGQKHCSVTYFGFSTYPFLRFNCLVIFPFIGDISRTKGILNVNFQNDQCSFLSFLQY